MNLIYLTVFYFFIIYAEARIVYTDPRQACSKLIINHAVIRYKKNIGFARIRCQATHFLIGHNYIHCLQRKWVGEIPKCVSKNPMCNKIDKIPNGMVFLHSKYNNAAISFFCNPGYELKGPETIYCIQTKWDSILPQCIKSDGMNVITSCDFETPDLCGWTQDINHDFDWKQENSKTATGHIATGPKFDHTMGFNNSGYYMIIEGQKARTGDTARLFSPLYNLQNFTCFEFYYHMFGPGIKHFGTLNVYVKQESVNIDRIKPVWTKFGNQGNKWYRGLIKLVNVTEAFQIIIEAVRGTSFLSNIAIDDVKLLTSCDENENSTDVTEEYVPVTEFDSLSCNGRCFETNQQDGALCQCDSNCYDNNNCCPDYISVCVAASGWSTDYTIMPSTPIVEQTPETTKTTKITTYIIRTKATTVTRPSTFPTITMKSTPKTALTTVKKEQQTTVKKVTTPITKTTLSSKPINKTTLKPVTPPLKTHNVTKLTSIFVSTPRNFLTESTISNDLIVWDENNFKIPVDTKPKILNVFRDNTEKTTTHRAHVQLIVISILVVLALTGIIAMLAIKLHKRKSANRQFDESATDVRYLTSDEVLDFTLATPSKDSDLLLGNN